MSFPHHLIDEQAPIDFDFDCLFMGLIYAGRVLRLPEPGFPMTPDSLAA